MALLATIPTRLAAQGREQVRPYQLIPVQSCEQADRLLGPSRGDERGVVRGFRDTARDTTYLETVTRVKPPDLTSSTKVAGNGSPRDLAVQVTVFVRDRKARNVAEASRDIPARVVFVLDESVTVYATSTTLGRMEGDSVSSVLPVSARLVGDDAFKVARARVIVMRMGLAAYQLTDEHRELRALLRVALCYR